MKDFVKNILRPIDHLHGDDLPVSKFVDRADGVYPQGSAAFEKRGIAITVPEWDGTKCAQCNLCSMVCPHAVIRPVCLNEEEAKNVPEGTQLVKHKKTDYQYAIIVSTLDCTGCGSCANVCPTKSLTMKPIASQLKSQQVYDALSQIDAKPEVLTNNTIGVQYRKPYLEFSGACAGCGETPYAKLATQLYGDRMYIANATGCSSIWGGSAPSTPYTVDKKATALLGLTHSLRIMPNSVTV